MQTLYFVVVIVVVPCVTHLHRAPPPRHSKTKTAEITEQTIKQIKLNIIIFFSRLVLFFRAAAALEYTGLTPYNAHTCSQSNQISGVGPSTTISTVFFFHIFGGPSAVVGFRFEVFEVNFLKMC